MAEAKTPRAALVSLIKAMNYANDLLTVYEGMPRDRAHAFARRNGAPLGVDVWKFLIDKAEEFEVELHPS